MEQNGSKTPLQLYISCFLCLSSFISLLFRVRERGLQSPCWLILPLRPYILGPAGGWIQEGCRAPSLPLSKVNHRRLEFDDERKSPQGNFIGNSPHCDIVLPRMHTLDGIAPYQCAITFDEQRWLILRDLQNPEDARRRRSSSSKYAFIPRTAVSYGGKGGQKRCGFTWIISGHDFTLDNQPIIIALHDNLKFQIGVAHHDIYSHSYRENVARFMSGPSVLEDDLTLGRLGLASLTSTAALSVAQRLAKCSSQAELLSCQTTKSSDRRLRCYDPRMER